MGAEGNEIVINYSNEKPGILANISFPLTQLPSSEEGLVVNHIQVTSWVFYALILCFVIQKTKNNIRDFPGGSLVKTLPSNAGDVSSIPGQRVKIPHACWPKNQNIKQRQYCNKFNKDFENDLPQKKS